MKKTIRMKETIPPKKAICMKETIPPKKAIRMKKAIRTLVLVSALVLLGIAGWNYYMAGQEQQVSAAQSDMRPDFPEARDGADSLPLMDFREMLARNPDIVGWIAIKELGLDYPVVQGGDNRFYLNHSGEKKAVKSGALFLDYRVSRDFTDFNSIIYGHKMKSGRMFGRLAEMKSKEKFDAVTEGLLYTPDRTYRLEIFALAVAGAQSDFYNYVFPDRAGKKEHLQRIRIGAKRYRDIGVTENDRLIGLSTCSYEYKDARTILFARLGR